MSDSDECYRIGFYVYGFTDEPYVYNARFLFPPVEFSGCEPLVQGDNEVDLTIWGTGIFLTGTIRLNITKSTSLEDCECEL
jgi:hypothetical protein